MSTNPVTFILAGGRSQRFGGSKLMVRVGGESLLAWQIDRLRGWSGTGCERQWLSVAPGTPAPAPGAPTILPPGAERFQRWVADRFPFAGPLSAIEQALSMMAPDDVVAVAPADMPVLTRHTVARLAARLDRDTLAVMGRWVDGPQRGAIEPMPSVWRGRSLVIVRQFIANGGRSVRQLAIHPQVACVDLHHAHDAAAWSNINYADDLASLRNVLGVAVTRS